MAADIPVVILPSSQLAGVAVDRAGHLVPAGQLVHAVYPFPVEYYPKGHFNADSAP